MVISGKLTWHISQRQAASPLSVCDKEVWVLSARWPVDRVHWHCWTEEFYKNSISQRNQETLMMDCQRLGVCVLCGPFSAATCCINIVVQTSLRAIWSESHNSSVELTCENSHLRRSLCHWPTILKGLSVRHTNALRLVLRPLSATRMEFVETVPSQFPKWSRAGKAAFHTSDPGVYVIWKPLRLWAGAPGWEEAGPLKKDLY